MKDDIRKRLKKHIEYHVKMEKTWLKNMVKYTKSNDTLAAADAASSAERHLFAANALSAVLEHEGTRE